MTNLQRLNIELNEKKYFDNWEEVYTEILDENGLDAEEIYSKENNHVSMLESVYAVLQSLSNNIDAFRKIETEFTTVSAAYQYLQKRLKDLRVEINRIKDETGIADRLTSYMFFNS